MVWTAALATAVMAAAPTAPATPLNLICQGAAQVDRTTNTLTPYGLVTTEGRATVDDSVGIRINDGNGEARLPRRMLPTVKTSNHDGWFPLIHLTQNADEITGQVRLNQFNKPRVRIDRIAGTIRIDGPLGDFNGQCQAYTPETERKF
jgi:hypothetical protein